jgi:hypothetical protein
MHTNVLVILAIVSACGGAQRGATSPSSAGASQPTPRDLPPRAPLSQSAQRVVDGPLMAEYVDVRWDRKDVLRGLGRAAGCIDADKRKELLARQVNVSVLAAPGACKGSTIFAFSVQADQLGSLASLPWIMQLDADHQSTAL